MKPGPGIAEQSTSARVRQPDCTGSRHRCSQCADTLPPNSSPHHQPNHNRRLSMTKFALCLSLLEARKSLIPVIASRSLGGGAYGITSGMVNTMFLVTKKGVIVV